MSFPRCRLSLGGMLGSHELTTWSPAMGLRHVGTHTLTNMSPTLTRISWGKKSWKKQTVDQAEPPGPAGGPTLPSALSQGAQRLTEERVDNGDSVLFLSFKAFLCLQGRGDLACH